MVACTELPISKVKYVQLTGISAGISALYANKINPALWEDVNLVEAFGFLSMSLILS